jgi:redox-sensitive bicupin YhaK (pirin superfamily)
MSISIYTKENQADGNFNYGEILEKKPIGFPQDGGKLKPYSNLFYWAHAWTSGTKSTIGLHPHQGFEICSFVLKGNINHYDTKQNKWIPLKEGDVQIIRSGNGISHAEEIDDNSEIFQIWFDPDLSKSLTKEATYDDYSSKDFKLIDKGIRSFKVIVGEGSPMHMDSENVCINEHYLNQGNHRFDIRQDLIHSFFIIDGEIILDNKKLERGTFFTVFSEKEIVFESFYITKVFEIISPLNPSYRTYSQLR